MDDLAKKVANNLTISSPLLLAGPFLMNWTGYEYTRYIDETWWSIWGESHYWSLRTYMPISLSLVALVAGLVVTACAYRMRRFEGKRAPLILYSTGGAYLLFLAFQAYLFAYTNHNLYAVYGQAASFWLNLTLLIAPPLISLLVSLPSSFPFTYLSLSSLSNY